MMTKKDFEAIAGALKDARDAALTDTPRVIPQIFDSLSRTLADVCATTNPRFQRARFLKACGVDVVNQPLHRNK